jgi:hypothetical protein
MAPRACSSAALGASATRPGTPDYCALLMQRAEYLQPPRQLQCPDPPPGCERHDVRDRVNGL